MPPGGGDGGGDGGGWGGWRRKDGEPEKVIAVDDDDEEDDQSWGDWGAASSADENGYHSDPFPIWPLDLRHLILRLVVCSHIFVFYWALAEDAEQF